MAGHVGVPGVGVHDVGPGAGVGDGEVDPERAQRRVGAGELRRLGVRRRPGLVAWRAEGVHPRVQVAARPQRPDQLGDVHPRAAVHLGRVLLGQHVDSHKVKLPVGHYRDAMSVAARKKVLAIVLAGGEGKRLMPLTADRAKPAVPFAGIYRLIDFALSNVVNSGYLRVVVLTQYKSHSLDRHVTQTWRMSTLLGNYVAPVPAQQRVGKHWYLGSADAIYQSLNLIKDEKPDIVVVVGADHVYRMDFAQMVSQHVESGAACTVAAIRQPIGMADQFGVIDVQPEEPSRIREFLEKPTDPIGLPDSPGEVLASMGNYVFDADALVEAVTRDSTTTGSMHDMGGDIVPAFVRRSQAGVYDYKDNVVPGATDRDQGYWRDVGTLSSYYAAHMDVVSPLPVFNLYNFAWPIFTSYGPQPPARSSRAPTAAPPTSTRRCSRPAPWSAAGPSSVPSCRRPPASARAPWWRVRSCWTASGSAPARSSATRSWTRTSSSPAVPRSASTTTPTGPAGSWSRTGSPCSARTSTFRGDRGEDSPVDR